MRAEQVIATHGNTDFDAFGAMLAARLLYPGAVVAVGSLNRNVRDFYRLHAEEFGAISEIGRLELDAIRRLIVVEVASASRLGELEPVALDPEVEKALFDHHGDDGLPDWVSDDAAVLSTDGALTTTLVGIVAERELRPTPLEATAFALGIHEDTGSLTYATTTQRDVDALSWCFRHGARQDLVNEYLHAPLAADERDLLKALMERLEPVAAHGEEVLRRRRAVAGVRRRRLEPRAQDRRPHRRTGARPPGRDGRACLRRRAKSYGHASTPPPWPACSAAAGMRRRPRRSHASISHSAQARMVEALATTSGRTRIARDVMSAPARAVGPGASVRDAMTLCQRHGQSGVFVVDDDRLVGSVGREDLDKAVSHDLAHAPVRGIMSSGS